MSAYQAQFNPSASSSTKSRVPKSSRAECTKREAAQVNDAVLSIIADVHSDRRIWRRKGHRHPLEDLHTRPQLLPLTRKIVKAVPGSIATLALTQSGPGSTLIALQWDRPFAPGGTDPLYQVVISTSAQTLAAGGVFESCLPSVATTSTMRLGLDQLPNTASSATSLKRSWSSLANIASP